MRRSAIYMVLLAVMIVTLACGPFGSTPTPAPTPTQAPLPTLPPAPTLAPPTLPPIPTVAPTLPKPTAPPTQPPLPTQPPKPTATVAPVKPTEPPVGSGKVVKPDDMVVVAIPGGKFQMGRSPKDNNASPDEDPMHTIEVSAFLIDKTEVTVRMYTLCVKAGACKEPISPNAADIKNYFYDPAYQNFPVVNIRWDDAKAYCEWAGRRLPTEAEWERAARGDDLRIFPWGADDPNTNLLNFNYLRRAPVQVGSYPKGASPYGVLDMAGNVWEWVYDYYLDDYYKQSPVLNPQGPASTFRGEARVFRGGAWDSAEQQVRVSKRGFGKAFDKKNADGAVTYSSNLGFRCAMSQK